MATASAKFSDNSGVLTANCFPVRSFLKQSEHAGGAWLVAHKAEQRRRFKAVLCAKPLSYEDIHSTKRASHQTYSGPVPPPTVKDEQPGAEDEEKSLDGFFLMKHCCVEDPAHLCSVNISGQNLTDAKCEDFALFDNVAYINAADNILSFECFKYFPILREIEQPLNGLMNINISPKDFPHLEICDLSYNNLSTQDLLALGLLPQLRVLNVTGNGLQQLPTDLAHPMEDDLSDNYECIQRYTKLEVLMLEDNRLSDINTFSALAGLQRLKHLNLAKNNIYSVPHLIVADGNVIREQSTVASTPKRRSSRMRSSRRSRHGITNPGELRVKHSYKSGASAEQGSHLLTSTQLNSYSLPEDIGASGFTTAGASSTGVPVNTEAGASTVTGQHEPTDDPTGGTANGAEQNVAGPDEAPVGEEHHQASHGASPLQADPHLTSSHTQLPLPFSQLEHLNLAHNKIYDEQGLLAVAVWPTLHELVIYDNPLVNNSSGDPPLLRKYLMKQFGIQITRLKPKSIEKPHIEVLKKPERQVSTEVARIPKVGVDELLAIEHCISLQEALPATPAQGDEGETQPQEGEGHHTVDYPQASSTGQQTAKIDDKQHAQDNTQAFFMTQLDDGVNCGQDGNDNKQNPQQQQQQQQQDIVQREEAESRTRARRRRRYRVPSRYKNYEDLLDNSDEETNNADELALLPTDLNGNVKALQYELNHSLIYRDPHKVRLDDPQPPHRVLYKAPMPQPKPAVTRLEKIENVLESTRTRQTLHEAPLGEVLKKPDRYGKTFGDADKLLRQVQHKYNSVRATSVHDSAHAARAVLDETTLIADKIKAM